MWVSRDFIDKYKSHFVVIDGHSVVNSMVIHGNLVGWLFDGSFVNKLAVGKP
jgi:hypothetical protein